jgi:YrbI family 3-deoxy-D-manno-octulosonate 8-phosphate phosphatase
MSIELIAYDFDGVMTDNHVYVIGDGLECVKCCRDDGYGVEQLKRMGIDQIIVTREANQVCAARGRKLNIPTYTQIKDKLVFLEKYCANESIEPSNVIFVGNGLNDVEVMNFVGIPICPQDAHEEVRDICDNTIILPKNGGDGVILELWKAIQKFELHTA